MADTLIAYPPAGVIIENGEAKANTALPGVNIHYTTNGSEPTSQSAIYNKPIPAMGTLKFKTFDASGKSGRTVVQEGAQGQKLN